MLIAILVPPCTISIVITKSYVVVIAKAVCQMLKPDRDHKIRLPCQNRPAREVIRKGQCTNIVAAQTREREKIFGPALHIGLAHL